MITQTIHGTGIVTNQLGWLKRGRCNIQTHHMEVESFWFLLLPSAWGPFVGHAIHGVLAPVRQVVGPP